MLDWLAGRLHVSPTVAGILLGVIIVQLALQLYALADLARRDRVRGDRKWAWVLVIAFGNLVGAIVYLAVGRPSAEVDIPAGGSAASTAGGEAARRAVDALYGSRDQR
jgi:Phospholipase_D-nuclease N-terminal